MQTRSYLYIQNTVAALAGAPLAPQEVARIKFFINDRARAAYAESEYWPRFYQTGEERIVSESGLLPYAEDGKQDIGTILRIHATEPFKRCGALEYDDFIAEADGIQITGYQPREQSAGVQELVVTGAINFGDALGSYYLSDENLGGTKPTFKRIPESTGISNAFWWDGDEWNLTHQGAYCWVSTDDVATPDLVTTWTPVGFASGVPIVTAVAAYSAYVTYKAALPDTYGDGEGEETEIPEEWASYIIRGSYADFLRSDGNSEKAMIEDAKATELLLPQLEKLDRQSGSHAFTRVLSHGSRQAR